MPDNRARTASEHRNIAADTGVRCATYRIFDLPIASRIPLPELPVVCDEAPQLAIRHRPIDPHEIGGFLRRHDWFDHGGRLLCSVARRDGDYLLSLPGEISFLLADGVGIDCCHTGASDQGLVRQALLSQVLPRYLAHTGELLLHASAVELPDGRTVAFLGASGQGKSTLASFCLQHRAQLVDDDCILLRCERRRVRIAGGAQTLRLYPDSVHALGFDVADFEPCANRAQKWQRLMPAAGLSPPRTLSALFLLDNEGAVSPTDAALRIERAGGQAAMMALLRSAFYLDPTDPVALERTFRQGAQLLAQGIPVYHLHYPRAHAQLPQVLQALLALPRE